MRARDTGLIWRDRQGVAQFAPARPIRVKGGPKMDEETPKARMVDKGILIEPTKDGGYRISELRDIEFRGDFAKEVEEATKKLMQKRIDERIDDLS